MSDDIWDDPEAQAWAKDVVENLVPKLSSSAANVTLYSGAVDVKLAVELGMTMLLDKPICLVIKPGTVVPDHLVRVADKIVEFGPNAPAEIAKFVADLDD